MGGEGGVQSLAEPVTRPALVLGTKENRCLCNVCGCASDSWGRKEILLALEWTGFRDAKCPSMYRNGSHRKDFSLQIPEETAKRAGSSTYESLALSPLCWRRKRQPTPVLLPGKFHGLRSLVGYSPWGCKEPDRTERLHSLPPSAGQGLALTFQGLLGLSPRPSLST